MNSETPGTLLDWEGSFFNIIFYYIFVQIRMNSNTFLSTTAVIIIRDLLFVIIKPKQAERECYLVTQKELVVISGCSL